MLFEWDDLKTFITAVRAGSFGGGGERLGIDPATVSRRVARLETKFKATLVVRGSSGLQLTAAGTRLFRIGQQAEAVMMGAASMTEGGVETATVRVGVSDFFGSEILAPRVEDLFNLKSNLKVELVSQTAALWPNRRGADLIVTSSPPNTQRLAIQPLARYQIGLFASHSYIERYGRPESISDLHLARVVGSVDNDNDARSSDDFDEILKVGNSTLCSSSIYARRAIISNGGGIGLLPVFSSGGLTRLLENEILIERQFWLCADKDIHETAPVRAIRRWLGDIVSELHTSLCPFEALRKRA